MNKITILGSGFSSLTTACILANEGYDVTVFEKNDGPGGRASQLIIDGFKFDMGPTWYWMPEVFDDFFKKLGKDRSKYYQIKRLDPAYEVYFGKDDSVKINADLNELFKTFSKIETGSDLFLKKFLKKSAYNYQIALQKVIRKPGKSPLELIMPETVFNVFEFVSTIRTHIHKNIKDRRLRQILEFPVLFLGAKPDQTPAFYKLMNHADLNLGTWYVTGGMYTVIESFVKVAKELGVRFMFNAPVSKIICDKDKVKAIVVNNEVITTDFVISGADYHHTEQLLPVSFRNYSANYWEKRTFAPSALLFYVGFNKKLENIAHHSLFFDTSFDEHAASIYDTSTLPETPLFYASFPSVTDDTIAPEDEDCGIFLIPLAPGINIEEKTKEKYFEQIISRLELMSKQKVKEHVKFVRNFSGIDFIQRYNACKGNAYGLANTLRQTAFLKPRMHNRKLGNLLYAGQLTIPGPGVPPAIISGEIAASQAIEKLKN